MDDLLPFYERELNIVRQFTKEFAEQYPKVAARLGLTGGHIEDPQTEQLVQSFAFIAARLSQKLDDDYPEFTEALLQVQHSHYLGALPSCTIAQFDDRGTQTAFAKVSTLAAKTLLDTHPVLNDVACTFSTVYPVHLSPLRISAAYYDSVFSASGRRVNGRISPKVRRSINIQFDVSGLGEKQLALLDTPQIRVFIDAPSSLTAQIRQAILHQTVQVLVESGEHWHLAPKEIVQPVGFSLDEPLFHYNEKTPLAYRLFAEFFAFPEKFNFFDISVAELRKVPPPVDGQLTLKFLLPEIEHSLGDERSFEQIRDEHFKLHCVPVVNLFEAQARVITKTHQASALYPLLVDTSSPQAYEIHDIIEVSRQEEDKENLELLNGRPLYALNDGDHKAQLYWQLHCDALLRSSNPGYEYKIALVDGYFQPSSERQDQLVVKVLVTNRDLPFKMPYGQSNGDLFQKQVDSTNNKTQLVRLLKRPTKSVCFYRGRDAHWKFISHLHVNEFALELQGPEAIKDIIRIYDEGPSGSTRKMIDGIVDLQLNSSTSMVSVGSYPMICMGVQVIVHMVPEYFVGTDLYLFAQMLDHYFAHLAQWNGFAQVILLHAHTKAEIFRCPPRFSQI